MATFVVLEAVTVGIRTMVRVGLSVLLLAGVAGCAAPPPPPVVELPPPPVGHIYPTLVEMPPAPRYTRLTLAQEQDYQQAFNVLGLKSALMVGALSCGQQDQYDAFMTQYQPHVLDAQHEVDAYFKRVDGRYLGQKDEDTFVTLLANNQTMGGIGQGPQFCLNNQAEFKAVMALGTDSALDGFVTDDTPEGPVAAATSVVAVTHHYYVRKKKVVVHTATVAAQ